MLSWRKRPRARYRSTELSAYLDERSDIEGTYTFSGTAMLNGKLEGVIQSTDTLIVGEKGVVNANITVSAACSSAAKSWATSSPPSASSSATAPESSATSRPPWW
jgi:hypothetical protein